jgi:tripartite-type tricarboxylate transporter receptor subunit TctC
MFPNVFVIHPTVPAKTLAEFVALARAKPGEVNYASSGIGGAAHLAGELFKQRAGIDMVHVPYKGGAGPAVTDVLGGHVDLMFTTISSAMEFVKAKKVKALAVTTRERIADLPDTPTMYELGWKDLVTSSWQGVLVPTGTPRPIVDKLHAAIVKVLAEPEIQARMRNAGVIAVVSKSPEEFKAYMDAETAKWTKVIDESGVRAD